MQEGLVLTWDDLKSAVGFELGLCPTRVVADMSDNDRKTVETLVNEGLRIFYYTAPLPGMSKAHEWSFLRPIRDLITVSGTYAYDLPSDFGGFDGDMLISSSSALYCPLQNTGIGQIMRMQAINPGLTAQPTFYAETPKAVTGAAEQGFAVWLHPTPGAVYTIRYRFRVNPNKLTSSRPYPYGGAAHSQTILASCLAVAERRMNNGQTVDRQQEFLERLSGSISQDQEHSPGYFGYNGNRSRQRGWPKYDRTVGVQALYNGYLPENYPG